MEEKTALITIHVLSLFPGYFSGPFDQSMIKRAREAGLVKIELVDIRDFATNKHKTVDDRPYGGGPGMVMMAPPVTSAIRHCKKEDSYVVYLSPQGKTLTTAKCQELAKKKHLILLAGHYEGVDERVVDCEVDEEISIGDYVLTNGCIAAIVLTDAVLRFVPHFLGDELSSVEDSFVKGLLDHPHYTRPEEFEGRKVPDVLLNGNHQEIKKWREEKAYEKTKKIRPDLLQS